jgi:hypothetical protein
VAGRALPALGRPRFRAAGGLASARRRRRSAGGRQLTERTRAGDRLAQSLRAVLGPLSLGECWLLALVSGVAEEAFFRGALQPQVGLLAASLLFGAAHFVPRRELLLWTVFSIAAGLLLGWLFDATGNLVAPVVAHAGINGVNLRHLTRQAV